MTTIVGHRGAVGYAPENTLLSFRTAIAIGCDRAELDVRLTKDNEVVVFHGDEVSKLTNGAFDVTATSLDKANGYKKIILDKGKKLYILKIKNKGMDLCNLFWDYFHRPNLHVVSFIKKCQRKRSKSWINFMFFI